METRLPAASCPIRWIVRESREANRTDSHSESPRPLSHGRISPALGRPTPIQPFPNPDMDGINCHSTTTQPSLVLNPKTIPTQPSRIRDFPTTTQPLAKGFVRRRPKAPPHGASANTPYPFARTFAPPPHCRRVHNTLRRYKTLSDFIPTTTTLCKRSGDGGGEGRALRGRMRPRDSRPRRGRRAGRRLIRRAFAKAGRCV